MKKTVIFVFALVASLVSYAAAAPRVGTVNIEQVFKAYYKTAQIDGLIKQQAQVFRDYLSKENDKLLETEKKFNLARDRAQNIALSREEQSKAQEEMASLAGAIRAKRAEMEAYAVDRNKYMVKFESDKRAEIMAEITEAVSKEAERKNLLLVLDNSGRTFNEVPAVIYANKALDITTEVVNALNRGQAPKSPAAK